ncbi:MAG: hypothetical protein ABI024_12915, partial [Vicinamibacterales bacterium]
NDTVRRAGIYRAIVAPLPSTRPDDRLTLQITLKPASLKTADKLVIARTVGCFGYCDVTPDLIVHEQSNTTRISELNVSRISASAAGLPIAAGVTPTPRTVTLAPGAAATIPYQLDGSFPLGVVSGKLWLSARELPEPKELEFEVRSRLSSLFIPIIIGLGFLLGYFVRVHLANVIAVSAARDQASTLLSQIAASLAERRDDIYKDKLKEKRAALDAALSKDNAETITKATTELDAIWREAVTDYAKRKTTAAVAVEELRELAAPRFLMPPVVPGAFQAAVTATNAAQEALDGTNVALAQSTVDAARKSLVDAVQSAALDWQDQATAALNELATAQLGLPAVIVTEFAQRLASMPALNQITAATPLATEENRRGMMLALHTEYRAVRNLLQEVANRLETEWGLVKRELRSLNTQTPAFAELEAAIASLVKLLGSVADGPRTFAQELSKRLSALDTQWETGVLNLVADEAKRQPLHVHLQSREYVQLARGVANAAIVPLLSRTATPPPIPVGVWAQLPDTATGVGLPRLAGSGGASILVASPIAYISASRAKFLQSLLLAALYILIYWMLSADTFGEKWSEPATLLGTSFFIDITAAGLLAALNGKIGVTN